MTNNQFLSLAAIGAFLFFFLRGKSSVASGDSARTSNVEIGHIGASIQLADDNDDTPVTVNNYFPVGRAGMYNGEKFDLIKRTTGHNFTTAYIHTIYVWNNGDAT